MLLTSANVTPQRHAASSRTDVSQAEPPIVTLGHQISAEPGSLFEGRRVRRDCPWPHLGVRRQARASSSGRHRSRPDRLAPLSVGRLDTRHGSLTLDHSQRSWTRCGSRLQVIEACSSVVLDGRAPYICRAGCLAMAARPVGPYVTRSGKARVTAAVRLETCSRA